MFIFQSILVFTLTFLVFSESIKKKIKTRDCYGAVREIVEKNKAQKMLQSAKQLELQESERGKSFFTTPSNFPFFF